MWQLSWMPLCYQESFSQPLHQWAEPRTRYKMYQHNFTGCLNYEHSINSCLTKKCTVCTCNPTLIFLVRAPSGKTAWTWGTRVLLRTPPSGPIKWLSCFIRDTTAKYCGKSRVMMRHILFFSSSSGESSSVKIRNVQYKYPMSDEFRKWKSRCKTILVFPSKSLLPIIIPVV